MLSDTAGLARDDIGMADVVEQRGLAVVDVAHDCNDRRTVDQIGLCVLFLLDSLSHFGRYIFGLEAEFIGHDIYGLGVEALIDRHHHTEVHTGSDDVVDGNVHHQREIVGGHKLCELQHTAFSHFGLSGLTLAVGDHLAFFLAPLCATLESLILVGQTRKRLFNLLRYVLVAHFDILLSRTAVAAFLVFGRVLAATRLLSPVSSLTG